MKNDNITVTLETIGHLCVIAAITLLAIAAARSL